MPKQILQDVIPPGRRSIRRIPLSFSRKVNEKEIDIEQIFKKRSGKRGSKFGIWLIAGATVLVLLIAVVFVFSGATVTIEPRPKNIKLDI